MHVVVVGGTDPVDATIEVAGPEELSLDALARRVRRARDDSRRVVVDPHVPFLGALLGQGDRSLLPTLHVVEKIWNVDHD